MSHELRARVFDNLMWQEAGGDDKNGNDKFYMPCTIIALYLDNRAPSRYLVDVIFDHRPERVSRAHFITSIKQQSLNVEDRPL